MKEGNKMNNWDLNRLYKTKNEWEEDYKALEGMLDKAQDFKGNLASEEEIGRASCRERV